MLPKMRSGCRGSSLCCLVLSYKVQFRAFNFQKSWCSLFSCTSVSERSKHSISGQVRWRIPLLETTEKMREELLFLSPFKESISSQIENSSYSSGRWGGGENFLLPVLDSLKWSLWGLLFTDLISLRTA